MDQQRYPKDVFKDLYFKRWGIEEDFKRQKHFLLIERFSGKSNTAMLQDLYAKVLVKNMVSLIVKGTKTHLKEINTKRNKEYKINFKQALSKCKHELVKCFFHNFLESSLSRLIELIVRCIEQVRRGRKFPRKRLVGTRCAAHGTYKYTR